MKNTITLKNIEIGTIKLGEVKLESEYSVTEVVNIVNATREIMKDVLKNMPETISDLETAYYTFAQADERAESFNYAQDIRQDKMNEARREAGHVINKFGRWIINKVSGEEVSQTTARPAPDRYTPTKFDKCKF